MWTGKKGSWKFTELKRKWDERILPVIDLWTIDGSQQHFALLVTRIDRWDSENDFLNSLSFMGCDPYSNSDDRNFDRLLSTFNQLRPDLITIHPHYTSKRKVLFDDSYSTGIMWEEHGRYYVYYWTSSA